MKNNVNISLFIHALNRSIKLTYHSKQISKWSICLLHNEFFFRHINCDISQTPQQNITYDCIKLSYLCYFFFLIISKIQFQNQITYLVHKLKPILLSDLRQAPIFIFTLIFNSRISTSNEITFILQFDNNCLEIKLDFLFALLLSYLDYQNTTNVKSFIYIKNS